MISVQQRNYYSEVYGVLNLLGDKYIEKLPKSLYQLINNERNINYTPVYDEKINISEQNITNQALAIIMLFHYNYWCESEQEKEQLKKILNKNQVEIEERYNIEKIFERRNQEEALNLQKHENEDTKKELVVYKETFIQKIRNFIRKLLHK